MGENPDDIVRAQLMRERARAVPPTMPMSARPGMGQPESEKGVYTAGMGPPPMEPDAGVLGLLSRPPRPRPAPKPPRKAEKKETEKLAKGGKVRGGGCEQRGKTRGKFV